MLTNRPLPPHLTIYNTQLTSTFPISHRFSGAFLATMVLFSPLLYPKMGLFSFTYENVYQSSPSLPKFILSTVDLTTLALCYHMSNGVHHLWRDFVVRLTSFFDIYRFDSWFCY
ncbi:unnamed protein product [Victoria cruziana]